MLCFLHIPKCGGSTIRDYIRRYLYSQDCKSDPRNSIFAYGHGYKLGDINIKSDELAGLRSHCQPESVKAIVGHFSYRCLTTYLGHNNTYGITFTLTRHPISRMISNINYIRFSPKHSAHEFFSRLSRENIFKYCSEVGEKVQSTYQLRILTGLSHKDIISNTDLAIDLARRRLKIYRVENSVEALRANVLPIDSDRLEIKNSTKSLANTSGAKPDTFMFSLNDFSEAEIRSLENIYQPDLNLYNASR